MDMAQVAHLDTKPKTTNKKQPTTVGFAGVNFLSHAHPCLSSRKITINNNLDYYVERDSPVTAVLRFLRLVQQDI